MTAGSSPTALTWVFAGDSITQGVQHTHGARCWVEHVHERLRYQLGRYRDVVINTGIAGWTAPQVLREFDHLVARFEPDVVSIALGMNDAMAGPPGLATFADSLGELARSSAELGASVLLHTPNRTDAGPGVEADVAAYAGVVRDIAGELGLPVVDHHAHWTAHFGGQPPRAWLDEAVHPNAAGHRAMADLTLETLGLGPLLDW